MHYIDFYRKMSRFCYFGRILKDFDEKNNNRHYYYCSIYFGRFKKPTIVYLSFFLQDFETKKTEKSEVIKTVPVCPVRDFVSALCC